MSYQDEENELYKQQCKVVKQICELKTLNSKMEKVRVFKELLKKNKNNKYDNSEPIKEIKKENKKTTDLIDFVLDNMNPFNSWIIKKSFMDKNENLMSHWYEEFFSKTTYYKKKKEAIREFMGLYFDKQYNSLQ
ncbi:MG284/MPN403 family protein [Mycoplasmopsis alligatoris]|uniref:Uncharacterized protein n=1 Tax=Mycoplasmopsis alligatoris A21JP2 TaxID=747682 RepID=D4XWT2_9BACT|nr:hypothetical protein [Mycoplasmopsis alligatoris]EFF41243.1 conserved hypothetical protein [Mycoplasmopsis alligatoris A21JP2]